MTRYILLLCSLFCFRFTSFSQIQPAESQKIRRFEFALNITNSISRFAGNGAKNVTEDPYIIAVKWTNKKQNLALRLGFNQFYNTQTTDLFGGSRTSREWYFSPLIGIEKRVQLDKHFMFYFGLDGRTGTKKNTTVSFFNNFGRQEIIEDETSYGAGPFCGFAWKINPRVMLYTEANFYINYKLVKRQYDDGMTKTILENSKKITLNPVIPTSLFLAVNF
ncbi:MAG: hypothetical protein KG003_11285 [Bacteroidetes bacterium]|nr:hypothetical protein [Bacteroidota bacterium]